DLHPLLRRHDGRAHFPMPGVNSVGRVLPHVGAAVDCWRGAGADTARVFFLTHMHGDHYTGLHPAWNRGPIYCTEVTARLAGAKFGPAVGALCRPLEIGTQTMIYADDTVPFAVTPLPANHCPGACMFVFEGPFGRILHTGDFRFTPAL